MGATRRVACEVGLHVVGVVDDDVAKQVTQGGAPGGVGECDQYAGAECGPSDYLSPFPRNPTNGRSGATIVENPLRTVMTPPHGPGPHSRVR